MTHATATETAYELAAEDLLARFERWWEETFYPVRHRQSDGSPSLGPHGEDAMRWGHKEGWRQGCETQRELVAELREGLRTRTYALHYQLLHPGQFESCGWRICTATRALLDRTEAQG